MSVANGLEGSLAKQPKHSAYKLLRRLHWALITTSLPIAFAAAVLRVYVLQLPRALTLPFGSVHCLPALCFSTWIFSWWLRFCFVTIEDLLSSRSQRSEAVLEFAVVKFLPKVRGLVMASTLSAVRRAALVAVVVVATMGSTVVAQAPAPEPAPGAASSVAPSILVASFVSLLGFVVGKMM